MNFESNLDLLNNMFKSQSIFIVYVIEKVSITIFNSFRLFLRLLWWSYLRIHSWLIGKNPIVKPWARRSSAFPGITTSHSFCSNSKLAWKRTARPPRGRAQPCQELTMSVSGCISSNRYVNCPNISKQKKKEKRKKCKLPKQNWYFDLYFFQLILKTATMKRPWPILSFLLTKWMKLSKLSLKTSGIDPDCSRSAKAMWPREVVQTTTLNLI